MDQRLDTETSTTCAGAREIPAVETASAEYLGRWNRLVSSTNWEKGRIIVAWRDALAAASAPANTYTDEAWAERVGNISSQHVGRLRRVHERFGEVREQYAGLYWSHFQATLDWPDAEMWLEGAVQSGWSVSQMRQNRWEAYGGPAELQPTKDDIIQAEFDEDVAADDDAGAPAAISASLGVIHEPQSEADDGYAADYGGVAAVDAAAAAGPQRGLRAVQAGSAAPQALALAGSLAGRRAGGLGGAEAVGAGPGRLRRYRKRRK